MAEQTPDPASRLLAEAARLREEAARLHETGREAIAEGDRRIAIAAQLEALAGGKGLPTGSRAGSLRGDVLAADRLTRSVSLAETRGKTSDLHGACVAAGMTLREFAGKIGFSHAYVSQAATGVKRPSPRLRAAVEDAIGWDNWPPLKPRPKKKRQ